MSYDLTFAKPKRKIAKKRVAELYDALGRGESNDAFERLPVEDILSALCEAYEDFEPAVNFPMIEDGDGAAEVGHSTHSFTFCFRGDTAEMQQRIADIFRRFGCPVYDPQVGVLYPLDQPPAKFGLKELQQMMPAPDEVELAFDPKQGYSLLFRPKTEEEAKRDEMEMTALLERNERKKREDNRAWYEPVEKLAAQIARECAGGRWQRFGLDAEECAGSLHNMCLFSQKMRERPPHDELAIRPFLSLLFLHYLEAIPSGQELSDVTAHVRTGVARAVEYFHGDWREGYREFYDSEPMTRQQTRTKLGWIDPYCEGLLMALYLDDETAIRRLIEWPDTDVPVDDGTDKLTFEDNLAHIALACRLRGEPENKVAKIVEKLSTRTRKRPIAFWAAAVAALEKKSLDFATSLKQLSDLYRKLAKEQNDRLERPHVDGTILWHLARRSGIALPDLSEWSLDRIVR